MEPRNARVSKRQTHLCVVSASKTAPRRNALADDRSASERRRCRGYGSHTPLGGRDPMDIDPKPCLWCLFLVATALPATGHAQDPGKGPQLVSPQGFELRQIYAPVVEGNPPPRIDNPKLAFDSFLPTRELWTRVEECGGLAIVALKRPDRNRGFYLGQVYITESEFLSIREAVVNGLTTAHDVTTEHVGRSFVGGPKGEFRPTIYLKLSDELAIDSLRTDARIDFIEPFCPNDLQLFSFAGCYETTQDGVTTLPDRMTLRSVRSHSSTHPAMLFLGHSHNLG
jgi:hypothetical protein